MEKPATLAMLTGAGADPSVADPKAPDSVAITRERKLPGSIIARMESLRRSLHGPSQ